RLQHLTGGTYPLRYFAAEAARRQEHRRLRVERQVVHLVAHLAADLEHVGETLGGDQADTGTLALQHGVGGHRGAVHKTDDLPPRQPPIGSHARQRLQYGNAWLLARARELHDAVWRPGTGPHPAGELAADIDAHRNPAAARHWPACTAWPRPPI